MTERPYTDAERAQAADDEKDDLIRELLAALERIRDFRNLNARAPDPIVEEALAKAKAAGYSVDD